MLMLFHRKGNNVKPGLIIKTYIELSSIKKIIFTALKNLRLYQT